MLFVGTLFSVIYIIFVANPSILLLVIMSQIMPNRTLIYSIFKKKLALIRFLLFQMN
jgi:hypothetical protein